jgi:hypothetical protein
LSDPREKKMNRQKKYTQWYHVEKYTCTDSYNRLSYPQIKWVASKDIKQSETPSFLLLLPD